MPSYRMSAAIAWMAVPVLFLLVGLTLYAGLHPLLAIPVAIMVLVGAVLVWRHHRRFGAALSDHVQELAKGGDIPPLAPDAPEELRELSSIFARFHRDNARRNDEVRSLLEAEEAVIEALHDPLILVSPEREVVRANQAARTLFGGHIVGNDLSAMLRNPAVLEGVDAVLAGASSRIVEFTIAAAVERSFEARIKLFPMGSIPTGSGEARRGEDSRMVMVTLRDFTALRRSEQLRQDFVANASHELRTPLSSLLGFIETLRGPARDDPEAQQRFLGIMHDQASRMSRLVNDLLSLSRIELDEHLPPAGRVDVLDELDGVLAALELKAQVRGIKLVLKAPENPSSVIGDEDQLTQVFQNLISNAIKYTRPNTEVTVELRQISATEAGLSALTAGAGLRPQRARQALAIAVHDQGEGIPRRHLPRLTERFYRVDAARSRAMGGTGLGLAIAKHILNRHGGRLGIESTMGQGSTFTAYLPVMEASPDTLPGTRAGGTRTGGDKRVEQGGDGVIKQS